MQYLIWVINRVVFFSSTNSHETKKLLDKNVSEFDFNPINKTKEIFF